MCIFEKEVMERESKRKREREGEIAGVSTGPQTFIALGLHARASAPRLTETHSKHAFQMPP